MQKLNLTRDLVGRRYPERRNYLSNVWVRQFVAQIDIDASREYDRVEGTKIIPSYFVPALRDGPFEVFDSLGIELKRLLHVSQDYHFYIPLQSETWVTSVTEISDLKEKSSKLGDIYLMDLKTEFYQKDQLSTETLMRVFVRRG